MRNLLLALLLALATWTVPAGAQELAEARPPRSELVLEIICDIAAPIDIGETPTGRRAIVPILGGSFRGNGITGRVLPGGADRQLVRSDGYKNLEARYELQTDDGQIISVLNEVLVRIDSKPGEQVFSRLTLSAPEGRYGWINREVYIGTLTSLRPGRQAVLIRVFRVIP